MLDKLKGAFKKILIFVRYKRSVFPTSFLHFYVEKSILKIERTK